MWLDKLTRGVNSLRFQLGTLVFALLLLITFSIGYAFYSEAERRKDYITLQSTGAIEQLIRSMLTRSEQYAASAARDWDTYFRDVNMYGQDLQNILANLSEHIPRHSGLSEHWINRWEHLHASLHTTLGDPAEPRLEAAAQQIINERAQWELLSAQAVNRTQQLLQTQLEQQQTINSLLLALALLLGVITLVVLSSRFSKPLNQILTRLSLLAKGETSTGHATFPSNEMGAIASSIERLSGNLAHTFQLTRNISRATDLDTALRFVFDTYKPLLPIDTLCLVRLNNDGSALLLDRVQTQQKTSLSIGQRFATRHCQLGERLMEHKPVLLDDLPGWLNNHQSEIITHLRLAGLKSALFYPFPQQSDAVLLFASQRQHAFSQEEHQLLLNVCGQLQHAFEKTELVEKLVISAVSGLSKLAESRDPETGDHLVRMALYSVAIAEAMRAFPAYQTQIDERYIRDLHRFAPMHDIGKVGVADQILLKPGRLTPEERLDMELHPAIGGDVLRRCEEQLNASGHSLFQMGIDIAEGHHEKWNGEGYPHGWKGQEIPLSARIVAVADVFDALTSKRPYKDAWPVEKAVQVLKTDAGSHFDPDVVAAFELAMPAVLDIYEAHKHV